MKLYTIGYQGKKQNDFIWFLINHKISLLIDVREIPISRKKGFSKTALSTALKNKNIEYTHLRELGSPKKLRHKLYSDNNYNYFFKQYTKYLKSDINKLETLYNLISNKKSCLMCYEELPEICHRNVIVNEIKNYNGTKFVIEHL